VERTDKCRNQENVMMEVDNQRWFDQTLAQQITSNIYSLT
jgi:hypothetical protein